MTLLPEKTNQTPVPFNSDKIRTGPLWLLFILCAIAAALLLPKDDPFPYTFKPGRLWQYSDYHAPFDLILPESVSDSDTNDRMQHALPFYVINPETGPSQKKMLNELITEQVKISSQDAQYEDLVRNTGAYRKYGQRLLDAIYKKGIVENRPVNVKTAVLVTQTSRTVPVDSLLLVDDAVGIVTDSLPFSSLRQPELLLPLIEKVLVPNAFYSDSLTIAGAKSGDVKSGSQKDYKKGDLIIRENEEVTPEKFAALTLISNQLDRSPGLMVYSGYFLYSLLAFFSLLGWLYNFKKSVYNNKNKMLILLVALLFVQMLIGVCFWLGSAIPLLVPLFLLPLLFRQSYGLRTSLIIWSVPVMLTGFALSWGMLWISLQIVGAGTALILNDQVVTWKERIIALCSVFAAQSLVLGAYYLAGKLPEELKTTDAIVFLGIAVLLSISRSVLVRFSDRSPEA